MPKVWDTRRDHPHLRSPAGIMSCEEIRYHVKVLLQVWPKNLLARTLGIDRQGLKSKLRSSWIYPAEQIRFSRALDRILSGELVPVRTPAKSGGPLRCDAALAEHPVPLKPRIEMAYSLAEGRLGWRAPREVKPRLPAFAAVLSGAIPKSSGYWRAR